MTDQTELVRAAKFLIDLRRKEPLAREALLRIQERLGQHDLYAWAEAEPDVFMAVAADMAEAFDQIVEFETRVAQGDIT